MEYCIIYALKYLIYQISNFRTNFHELDICQNYYEGFLRDILCYIILVIFNVLIDNGS